MIGRSKPLGEMGGFLGSRSNAKTVEVSPELLTIYIYIITRIVKYIIIYIYIYTKCGFDCQHGEGQENTSKIVSSFARNGWSIFFAPQRWQLALGNPLKHSKTVSRDDMFYHLPSWLCQNSY